MKTPHRVGRSKSYESKTKGQGLVEFALILPLLLFLLLGIIDYGRILLVFSNASSAVRNATRQGTLVGTVVDPDMGTVPRYMACATIADYANDVFGATINTVDILYFSTEGLDSLQRETMAANLEALDPNNISTLDVADFDCVDGNGRGDNPRITAGSLVTGDLMVILLSTEIEFITPLLSDIFPTFEITFRSQRTVVESLVINVSGADRDGDGLLDAYELEFFGCVLENTESASPPVFLIPDNTLAAREDTTWYYVLGGYTPPDDPTPQATIPGDPLANHNAYTFPNNCAKEDLPLDTFDSPEEYERLSCTLDAANDMVRGCIVVATGLFSSTTDPDNDGCNNGCEQERGTIPYNYVGAFPGSDTDGDGLSDGAEIGLGTDPNDRDSDGDGLWDGTEVCQIMNADGVTCDSSPTVDPDHSDGVYAYLGLWSGNTDPNSDDSDDDGLDDLFEWLDPGLDPNDADSDDDLLIDGRELNEGYSITLTINGITDTQTYNTDPRVGDTDNDGRSDYEEMFSGYIVSNGGVDITVRSNPNKQDSDDDGVCDGAGDGDGGNPCPTAPDGSAVADINPTLSDTDDDGLTDGEEQIIHGTDPDNENTDGDVCGLTDGYEMLSSDATTDADPNPPAVPFNADGDLNPDGSNLVNAADLSSDVDGIDDCEETTRYGSNPYNRDTDGDGRSDDIENLAINYCIDSTIPDAGVPLPCDGSDLDADGDGYSDAWEQSVFGNPPINGDETTYDLSDPADIAAVNALDSDGCDVACEYRNGTDPTLDDTDFDGLSDYYEDSARGISNTSATNPDTDGDGLWDGQEGASSNGTCIDLTLLQASGRGTFTAADCWATRADQADTDLDTIDDGAEVNGMTTISVDSGAGPVNVVVTSDPTLRDTDSDGLYDNEEINGVLVNTTINGVAVSQTIQSDPDNPDTDGDGRVDYAESKLNGTFANDFDTDNDTIPDGSTSGSIGELRNSTDNSFAFYGTNPLEADTDDDGLTDLQEITGFSIIVETFDSSGVSEGASTINLPGYDVLDPNSTTNLNPNDRDTDRDGADDGDETTDNGTGDWVTNPLVANTDGDVNTFSNPIVDGNDNCPVHDNTDQADADNDGIGDVCDGITAATTVFVNPLADLSNVASVGTWTPRVTVRAVDTVGDPQGSVNVQVTFTNPNNGDAVVGTPQTCTTAAGTGQCTLSLPSQVTASFPQLTATVTNLTNEPAGLTYDALSNDGPLTINAPRLGVYVQTIVGSNAGTNTSWQAFATVTVVDDFGDPVDGVDVTVRFTDNDGLVSDETCTTAGGNGQCSVDTGVAALDDTDPIATASILDITNLGAYQYNSASNAPDEDIPAPAPIPATTIHVDPIADNSRTATSTQWVPGVSVRAVDNFGAPQDGVTIEITFTDSGSTVLATQSCVTAVTTGVCTIDAPIQVRATTPVTATVTNLTNLPAGLAYDAPSNDGPEALHVPDLNVFVSNISGVATGTSAAWGVDSVITVSDEHGTTINGQTVEITFTDNNGVSQARTCLTSGAGQCTVSTSAPATPFDNNDPVATLTVTDIATVGTYVYDGTGNFGPAAVNRPGGGGDFIITNTQSAIGSSQALFTYTNENISGVSQAGLTTRVYFGVDGGRPVSDYRLDIYNRAIYPNTPGSPGALNTNYNPTITGPIYHSGTTYYYEIAVRATIPADHTFEVGGRLYVNYNASFSNWAVADDWWYNDIYGLGVTTHRPIYNFGGLNTGQEPPVQPDLVVSVSDIAGSATGTDTAWDPRATVTVTDENGALVSGQTVQVRFSSNDTTTSQTSTCITSAAGTCSVATSGSYFSGADTSVDVNVTIITTTLGYTATGGVNDTETIPAPPPAPSGVFDVVINASNNGNNANLGATVTNTSASTQSNVTVRLYFTPDGRPATDYQYTINGFNFSVGAPNYVGGSTLAPTSSGGSDYFLVTIPLDLDPGESVTFAGQFRAGYSMPFDITNDWWYTTTTGATNYIPVYIGGTLNSGLEP
ncbi:MAG: hypothetical protein Phog2KO_44280 [Phototrophicaceae bacterium]